MYVCMLYVIYITWYLILLSNTKSKNYCHKNFAASDLMDKDMNCINSKLDL